LLTLRKIRRIKNIGHQIIQLLANDNGVTLN
jgi:hypothetical protein